MAQLSWDPPLPAELKRDIFEMTARSYRGSASRLVLVARKVHTWIEPIPYETITLNYGQSSKFIRLVDSAPRIASYVRTLCITSQIQKYDVVRVLSACIHVVNIACWVPVSHSPLFATVENYRPRRLSINMTTLIGPTSEPDFSHPFFSNVTHLELTDSWGIWVEWFKLGELPRLTHVALDFHGEMEDGLELEDTLLAILTSSRTLEVCLLLIPDDGIGEGFPTVDLYEFFPRVDDPRFVIGVDNHDCEKGWEAFMFGEDDMWSDAEKAIQRRRSEY